MRVQPDRATKVASQQVHVVNDIARLQTAKRIREVEDINEVLIGPGNRPFDLVVTVK